MISCAILAQLPLFPERASTMAPKIDALFIFLLAVSGLFTLLICALIITFALRYRRKPGRVAATSHVHSNLRLELLWTAIPLVIALSAFAWGATLFVDYAIAPEDARTVYVVGKQWMWKVQHPEGRKEINELHIARGYPVRLTLVSDDVIHSFYVPAFRVKQDALPGRYTSLWFEATRTGEFDLFCAEYCGTNHSKMIGKIVVLEPSDFQKWLAGQKDETLAQKGRRLFEQFACHSCHSEQSGSRGPNLRGLPGSTVTLQSGRTVTADDAYLRESILNPSVQLVDGYENIMPTYKGQLDEEGVIALIEHIKSLGGEEQTP